jgi:MFS family permease
MLPDEEFVMAPGEKVDQAGQNSAARSWYVFGLLCLLFVCSLVDRAVLGILTVDINRDMGLTDAQIGVLIGTSFAVVYGLAGIPIADLLDRKSRKLVVLAGVSTWSVMTILSGFANSFWALAICRAGVALGEAALSPAIISLVADMFPKQRRVLPTAIYAGTGSLMTIGSLSICAAAYAMAEWLSASTGLAPWRLTLIACGVPPLLFAALFALTVKEPRRGAFDEQEVMSPDAVSIKAFFDFLRANRAFYLPLYLGTLLIAMFIIGLIIWTPTLLIRAHGFATVRAGYVFGLMGMAFGFIGAVFWARLVVVLGRRKRRDSILLGLALGSGLGAPFMALGPIISNTTLMLAAIAVSLVAAASMSALMPLTVQAYGPPHFRARLMSLVIMTYGLIGYGLGPPVIAFVAQIWRGNDMALGYALGITGLICAPGAALCYALAWRSRRLATEVHKR